MSTLVLMLKVETHSEEGIIRKPDDSTDVKNSLRIKKEGILAIFTTDDNENHSTDEKDVEEEYW